MFRSGSLALMVYIVVFAGCKSPELVSALADAEAVSPIGEWREVAYLASLYHRGNDNENEVDETGNANYLTAMHKIRLKIERHVVDTSQLRIMAYYSVIVPKQYDANGQEGLVFHTRAAALYWLKAWEDDKTLLRPLELSTTENETPTFHASLTYTKTLSEDQSEPIRGEVFVGYQKDRHSPMDNWYQKLIWEVYIDDSSIGVRANADLVVNPLVHGPPEKAHGRKPGELYLVKSNFKPQAQWHEPLSYKRGYSRPANETNPLRATIGSD